jgi:hypothetical protein
MLLLSRDTGVKAFSSLCVVHCGGVHHWDPIDLCRNDLSLKIPPAGHLQHLTMSQYTFLAMPNIVFPLKLSIIR